MTTWKGAPASTAASTTRPGHSVLPRKRSQWYGTSIDAPISVARRDGVAPVHVADQPFGLAVVGAAVDGQQRDVDAQRRQRRAQRVGDDRVARVVETQAGELEHVADEARVVGVAVGHRDAVDRGHDGDRAGAGELEPVAAVDARELRVRRRLAHERLQRRRGDDPQVGAARGDLTQRVRVEVVDVLVGDEQPVDAGAVLVDRQRRIEARLMVGEERVDEDPPLPHVEAERGLPQPGDDERHPREHNV